MQNNRVRWLYIALKTNNRSPTIKGCRFSDVARYMHFSIVNSVEHLRSAATRNVHCWFRVTMFSLCRCGGDGIDRGETMTPATNGKRK